MLQVTLSKTMQASIAEAVNYWQRTHITQPTVLYVAPAQAAEAVLIAPAGMTVKVETWMKAKVGVSDDE